MKENTKIKQESREEKLTLKYSKSRILESHRQPSLATADVNTPWREKRKREKRKKRIHTTLENS